MRGVFGLLLIGGGIILVYGLFTGKIQFPGGTLPIDPKALQNDTIGQDISVAIFGQGSYTPAQQKENAKNEPKQNVGKLPDKTGQCPPGMSYLPYDGKCYDLRGI